MGTSARFSVALIDLDGTLYRGHTVIPGAPAFVVRLRGLGIRPVFFTNNSTRTPVQVRDHLSVLGIACDTAEVCTSAQAGAALVREQVGPGSPVTYVGMEGVRHALAELGLVPVAASQDDAATVQPVAAIMGLETTLTYRALANFCREVERLQRFVLTNADLRLPVAAGIVPGNGAFGGLVTAVTGIVPQCAGKPEPYFIEFALARYGAARSEAVIIGDNAQTDIAAGKRAGLHTIQVLSGIENGPAAAALGSGSDSLADETYDSVDSMFR